jgi:putative membrane protein
MTASGEPAVASDPGGGRLPGWLSTYLTGLAMGSADAVPGVSGGTIALIAGIYDRLVAAIAAFEPGLLAEAVREPSHRPAADLVDRMDVRFLLALGLGMGTGVATVASAVDAARKAVPAVTFAFFFGLIAASALVLFEEVALDRRRERGAALAGFLLAFGLSGEGFRATLGHDPLVVFFAGAIAISAMILPGVSGSFLLLMLGQYTFMTGKLSDFLHGVAGVATGGSADVLRRPAVFVVAFMAGAGVGILTFARIVEAALERDREATLTFLVALMVGALRLPVGKVASNAALTAGGVAAVVAAALVGGGLVVALDRFTAGVGYE